MPLRHVNITAWKHSVNFMLLTFTLQCFLPVLYQCSVYSFCILCLFKSCASQVFYVHLYKGNGLRGVKDLVWDNTVRRWQSQDLTSGPSNFKACLLFTHHSPLNSFLIFNMVIWQYSSYHRQRGLVVVCECSPKAGWLQRPALTSVLTGLRGKSSLVFMDVLIPLTGNLK